MTWSMIARDAANGRIGIVVATCAFAVGARVPHIRTGVGAIATQALTNPYYGPRGLAYLSAGASAEEAVRLLLGADEGREHRQLHIMDRQNRFAAATGSSCIPWCGSQAGATWSLAGNMLAGEAVLAETARVYEDNLSRLPFARRLIAAMDAGQAAGGDKRGQQSAALLIHDSEDHAMLDLRVDDHTEPLKEIARLEAVARERFIHFRRVGPVRDNPAGLIDRDQIDVAIKASIAEGYE